MKADAQQPGIVSRYKDTNAIRSKLDGTSDVPVLRRCTKCGDTVVALGHGNMPQVANDGGLEESGNYLVDNSRLRQEFEVEYPPFRTRVLEIINDIRRQEGLPLVQGR